VIDRKRTAPDWEDVRVFLAVAEAGSLSGAARALGVNHATIARRLARLELRLGAGLLEKTATGYVLTAAGRAALEEARAMEAAAVALERRAEAGEALAGLVRISTVASFAERELAAHLAGLTLRHPGLEIELLGEDRNVSLARGDADIALRFGRPQSGEALARRIGAIGNRLYAAPAYLAATAEAERRFIGFSEGLAAIAPGARRLLALAAGRPVAMRCSTLAAQREAAAAGAGVALLPCYLAEADPRLARASASPSADWTRPLWLMLRVDAGRVARVRAVADSLLERLQAEAGRLAGEP